MPKDNDPNPSMFWVRAHAVEADSPFGDLAWWVMGGGSLLLWTALAVLLTSA